MNLTLDFNQEQLDAIAIRVTAAGDASAAAHLTRLITDTVDQYVKADFDNAIRTLGAAAAAMPYAERLALIQQVQATISGGQEP